MNTTIYSPSREISTADDYAAAESAAALCRAWHELKTTQHLSGNQAAACLAKSPAWFSANFPLWQRGGLAAFLPVRRELGASRRLFHDLPAWFLPVATFFYLNTNLNRTRGSIPEAVRRAISLPKCPPAIQRRLIKVCLKSGWQPGAGETLPTCPPKLRDDILARSKSGKDLVPATLARHITVAAPFVRHFRNPTDASLDYISAHGTQMWLHDALTGEKTFIRGGDVVECDDATVNFPCVVPWPMRGCPCSEKFEVKVARFQWLVAIDVGSRKVLAFSYTARPYSSYRTEDVLSLMRCVARQHGTPRHWRMEKGVWAAHRVKDAARLMGSQRLEVHSPHAKPFIEGLFNKLWTKLAIYFPDASVGRFQGEGEEASRLLRACQDGHQNPRRFFPTLAEAIAAFQAVIEEHNASQITSENYGSWIPNERWEIDHAARPLPTLNPELDWLFSPFMREWKIRGNSIGGKVPLFPGQSVPYQFQDAALLRFHGAKATAYFDPADPKCFATVVLAQPWGNHRAGEIIATAPQVNATTDYIRLAMGWGNGSPDAGRAALRVAHTALRREVRGIVGVKPGADPIVESETRDGTGNLSKLLKGIDPAPSAPASAPAAPIIVTSRNGKIARLPHAIREELNRRLHNGEVGKRLVDWLNSLPAVRDVLALEFSGKPIIPANLSNWKNQGGYRDWLAQQTPSAKELPRPDTTATFPLPAPRENASIFPASNRLDSGTQGRKTAPHSLSPATVLNSQEKE